MDQIALISTVIAPILFAVSFVARTHATTSPSQHRTHLVLLLLSYLSPSPTLRIVTCTVNLIELEEPDYYNPSVQAWFAAERTPHYVWHVVTYPNGALPVDNMRIFGPPPTCQYNVLSSGGAATAKWLRNTRLYFPNLLVGIPKEEISIGSGNKVDISPRSPTTPNSSSFAEVWRHVILPVIRYDHIFPLGGKTMGDEKEHPVLEEMTKVRGPLLGGQQDPYDHRMRGYIRDHWRGVDRGDRDRSDFCALLKN